MMEITVSSRPNSSFYCQIRKEIVKETPEERVRQATLSSLFSLGYPQALICVERKMADLPHLTANPKKMPNRRVDIICYQGQMLTPLLLVECKAKSFTDRDLRQLLGYNFYIHARFIALVCPHKMHILNTQNQSSFEVFPSYLDAIFV